MRKFRYRRSDVVIRTLTAGLLILAWSYQSAAQEQPTMGAFQLRPGVIVDADRRIAYVMSAEGGIDAVELAQGTRVWSTKQAAKPLALKDDRLISQAEVSGAGNELQIVILDTQQRGRRVVAGTMALPAGVKVSIDETLNSSFVAGSRALEGDAIVSWEHSAHPISGVPPGMEETMGGIPPGEEGALNLAALPAREAARPLATTSGTFQIDLSSGATSPFQPEAVPVALGLRPAVLTVESRVPGVSGVQFLSADRRHALSSQRIADDSVWDKYRLTIFDHGTGKSVGEFKSHLSLVSFFVLGSKVIYETGPYVRRTGQGMVEEPLKIRAVDLRTGQELWSWQVRDTTFSGAFPP